LRLLPLSKESGRFSHRLRTLFRDPIRSRPLARATCSCEHLSSEPRAPPLRFSPLQRSRISKSAYCPVPPERLPSSTFLRSSRVSSLLTPAALFRAAAAPGVLPSRAFPCLRTLPGSSPGDPLSAFLRVPKDVGRTLRGLCPLAVRIRRGHISSRIEPMLSWAFQASTALRRSWGPRLSTVLPLMTFSSEPFTLISEAGLQRFNPRTPGFSRSRERRPS